MINERPLQITFRLESFRSITCLLCGMTSYNRNDVKQRYCGRCNVYHMDLILFQQHGFHTLKVLRDGRIVGIREDGIGCSIYVLSPAHRDDRWYFAEESAAIAALASWEGVGDPVGGVRKVK